MGYTSLELDNSQTADLTDEDSLLAQLSSVLFWFVEYGPEITSPIRSKIV